ncbi:conserved hypothetical protein [Trichinella spiralis]|uniref:hypothetical protein n=1 Tax=Trichinella spiralis TaxID=6334 RepID=UPI0001EFD9C2|nr:conserved hypothetical protein [Trichinella spiralis]
MFAQLLVCRISTANEKNQNIFTTITTTSTSYTTTITTATNTTTTTTTTMATNIGGIIEYALSYNCRKLPLKCAILNASKLINVINVAMKFTHDDTACHQ